MNNTEVKIYDGTDLYRQEMAGIGTKVAMQVIRRIVRDNTLDDEQKLEAIQTVIHSFERDTKGE